MFATDGVRRRGKDGPAETGMLPTPFCSNSLSWKLNRETMITLIDGNYAVARRKIQKHVVMIHKQAC